MLFANAWAIHRTNEFAAPEVFDPERFVKNKFGIESGQADDASDKRRVLYGFGAGRRVCTGQRLAENSLVSPCPCQADFSPLAVLCCVSPVAKGIFVQIVNMVKVCWGFDIAAGEGCIDDGVINGYHGGFLICPKKFPLQISPRSDSHAEVIKREYGVELLFLSQFKARPCDLEWCSGMEVLSSAMHSSMRRSSTLCTKAG